MWWLLNIVLLCVTVFFMQKFTDRRKHLPPGPFRFPGIGCIIQVLLQDKLPFIAFEKLAKHYGNIMYVQIGINKGVVINGYDAINEVLHNDDWIGRFDDKFVLDRTFGKPIGLISARRDIWKETRKFCTKNLREFGFGVKSTMESVIHMELEEFCAHISHRIEKSNGVLTGFPLFNIPVINVIWSMVTGTRFDYEYTKLHKLFNLLSAHLKAGSLGAGLLTSYPFLCDWAPKLVGFEDIKKTNIAFQDYLKSLLEETRLRNEYKTNPTSFIEVYLQKIDMRDDNGTIEDIVYNDENLISILYDFFLAGSESGSNILSVGLLRLVLNPDIQEKVREEIDAVVGPQRRPFYTDKEKMPYTEATFLEIIRIANVAPLAPRKLDKDASIGKYKVPKGSSVFVNLHSVQMDPEFWGDPEVFRPERFLNSENKIVNADRMFPFSAGRRNCIGESVGRTTIFMTLTSLLQQFKFSVNPAEGKPSTDSTLGFTLAPKPFTVIATPRN